jgi:hypothetical protein
MVTYENQSPSEIRTGDRVIDALGREFTAESNATLVMGDYSVNAWFNGDVRSLILDADSQVTISYDESDWSQDEF